MKFGIYQGSANYGERRKQGFKSGLVAFLFFIIAFGPIELLSFQPLFRRPVESRVMDLSSFFKSNQALFAHESIT